MVGLLVGLVRFLVVLLFVRLVARFVGAVVRGYRGQFGAAPAARPLASRELVRDHVCGTFVARDRALSAGVDGETRYFCSAACRDAALHGLTPKALHG